MEATHPPGSGATLLVVDDDHAIALLLEAALGPRGYRILSAPSAAAAHTALDSATPDLILLDLTLPDADGLVLYGDLKARADVPVIICSASSDRRDPILSLRLGADDFVAKPFRIDELEARIAAVLTRRASSAASAEAATSTGTPPSSHTPHAARPAPTTANTPSHETLAVGDLAIDHARRQATLAGHLLPLTATEYRLLAALVQHADEVVTREELATRIWGSYDASLGRSIDVHVTHLRSKLAAAGDSNSGAAPTITVARGFGYRLIPAPRSIALERSPRSVAARRAGA